MSRNGDAFSASIWRGNMPLLPSTLAPCFTPRAGADARRTISQDRMFRRFDNNIFASVLNYIAGFSAAHGDPPRSRRGDLAVVREQDA